MATTADICNYLRVIIAQLNSDQNCLDYSEITKNVMKANNNYDKYIEINQMFEQIDSRFRVIDDNRQTLDDQLIKLCDLVINLLSLLNTRSEKDLLSVNETLIIESSIVKLISITFIPYLAKNVTQIQQLFQSNAIKWFLNYENNKTLSIDVLLRLSIILTNFIESKSLISNLVNEHCFAPIIAFNMSAINEIDKTIDNNLYSRIDDELNKLLSNSEPIIVFRNLLLLLRCKPTKTLNMSLSLYLSRCLISDKGLINLITAVIDKDETSERVTTLNQRSVAIATVVSSIPRLCCPVRQFYIRLIPQLIDLLTHTEHVYWKIGSMIVNGLENRSQNLTQELFINKLLESFYTNDNQLLSINKSIEIVHRLISCRYDAKKFVPIMSHMFYARVILDESLSHYKLLLEEILIDILSCFDKSVYLLDNALYNNISLINLYETNIVGNVIGININEKFNETNVAHSIQESNALDLKQIDTIVCLVVVLIKKLNENFKLDFFIILLERMTFNTPSLLTCSLVDSIQDEVSLIITKYPEKSVNFISSSLQRLATQLSVATDSEKSESNCDENYYEMQNNSIQLCLQIVKIIIEQSQSLSLQDICLLKQAIPSLEMLSKSDLLNENTKSFVNELKYKIDVCKHSNDSRKIQSQNEFETAMTQLNHHLMPERAHALIVLKRLIYARDENIAKNIAILINAFKMCLNDSESYIYLSAINSLTALAITHTDEVLPILTQQFNDSQRTIGERLNVGQALVQLSKHIGDFAHHYSNQFIDCFLKGTKSEEAAIRLSSLSNLGQFCGELRFAMKPYIVELMLCVTSILNTDPSIEVKRSAVMFLHLMLRGIDRNVVESVDEQLKQIYRLLKLIYSTTLDDVLQLHSQLAIEELNRIAKSLLTPNKDIVKNIQVLTLL